ncbi:MAG: hypothetical protein N2045_08205 [Fimbriimonadales bacterium]|nr:hypothetical protein [Fimbriimonadales bacterium]
MRRGAVAAPHAAQLAGSASGTSIFATEQVNPFLYFYKTSPPSLALLPPSTRRMRVPLQPTEVGFVYQERL